MKILVADRISPLGVDYLKKQDGFEVLEAYGSSPEEVIEHAKDASAIIVRSDTRVTREVMEAAPLLKAVGRAGVGVDNIDIEAATERGVIVMNTPGGNTIATAELTFAHAMWYPSDRSWRSWDERGKVGKALKGRSLGIKP